MHQKLVIKGAVLAAAFTTSAAWAQVDVLKKVKDTGTITMGVRDASGAMSFTTGSGRYTGFHVEVCERIVADIKTVLKLDTLKVNYQVVTPANRITLVKNGTVDLECGTTTNNEARQNDVAFAPTLYVEGVRAAVAIDSGIGRLAQLGGKTVVATTGSTSVQLLRKMKRDGGDEIKELSAKDNADGFLMLESGRADAFVADGQILATAISQSRAPSRYKLLDEVLSVEPIAIMIPKGDTAFKKQVDASVSRLASSGEAARLYDKWFMQPIPPSNLKVNLPANAMTKAAWASPNDKPLEAYKDK